MYRYHLGVRTYMRGVTRPALDYQVVREDAAYHLIPQHADAAKNLAEHVYAEGEWTGEVFIVALEVIEDVCARLEDDGWSVKL